MLHESALILLASEHNVIAIQKQIEDELSEMMLRGDIELGDSITIGGRSGNININNRSKQTTK